MIRILTLMLLVALLASCRSTRNIQTAIVKKDTAILAPVHDSARSDSMRLIRSRLGQLAAQRLNFTTFTAKVNVDYKGGDGKSYDVNANIRMYKDSAIWISANALLGIEAMRVLVTKDSVKLLNKLNKIYTARSVDYLQEVTALPLDLYTLQDLIIGNAVFLDSNIVSYSQTGGTLSLLSVGQWFKNLLTLSEPGATLLHSKLDDIDMNRSRTADLSYEAYESKKGMSFATKRRITVAEKTKLDIKLDFKQFDFDEPVSFPFSVPKNYENN